MVVAFAEPPEAADVRSLGELIGYEVVPVLGDPLAIGRHPGRRERVGTRWHGAGRQAGLPG